jgi:trk system potassium uptake protein TrkH
MLLVGIFLGVPLFAAAVFSESLIPYVGSMLIATGAGAIAIRLSRPRSTNIRPRDGFLVVGGSWIAVSLVGALPYLMSGALGPVDALFESVSGFTTTGSTVIGDVSVLPKSLLLWRALTQWIGGMGIILFTIAILPLLGIGGMQLFKAEVPGPVVDKVRPRLAATARSLWGIYVGLTAAETVLLWLSGLGTYEALCHALTTLPTGGFSTRNTSVGEFGSPTVEWIITVFMLLAGINFVLHYRLLTGRVRAVCRDVELRYFLGVVAIAVVAFTVTTHVAGRPLSETVRIAAFQTASILTTTGYATTDIEVWPSFALIVLLILMVLGGMSGSTGGGIKSLRALLAVTSLRTTLHRLIHPHAVRPVKYNGAVVPESVLAGIWGFLTAYMVIAALGSLVVTAFGYDIVTAISASMTAISNVGPGLGEVGSYDNFSHFPGPVKITLAVIMLFGRLEIFTLLAMISREFWRH